MNLRPTDYESVALPAELLRRQWLLNAVVLICKEENDWKLSRFLQNFVKTFSKINLIVFLFFFAKINIMSEYNNPQFWDKQIKDAKNKNDSELVNELEEIKKLFIESEYKYKSLEELKKKYGEEIKKNNNYLSNQKQEPYAQLTTVKFFHNKDGNVIGCEPKKIILAKNIENQNEKYTLIYDAQNYVVTDNRALKGLADLNIDIDKFIENYTKKCKEISPKDNYSDFQWNILDAYNYLENKSNIIFNKITEDGVLNFFLKDNKQLLPIRINKNNEILDGEGKILKKLDQKGQNEFIKSFKKCDFNKIKELYGNAQKKDESIKSNTRDGSDVILESYKPTVINLRNNLTESINTPNNNNNNVKEECFTYTLQNSQNNLQEKDYIIEDTYEEPHDELPKNVFERLSDLSSSNFIGDGRIVDDDYYFTSFGLPISINNYGTLSVLDVNSQNTFTKSINGDDFYCLINSIKQNNIDDFIKSALMYDENSIIETLPGDQLYQYYNYNNYTPKDCNYSYSDIFYNSTNAYDGNSTYYSVNYN